MTSDLYADLDAELHADLDAERSSGADASTDPGLHLTPASATARSISRRQLLTGSAVAGVFALAGGAALAASAPRAPSGSTDLPRPVRSDRAPEVSPRTLDGPGPTVVSNENWQPGDFVSRVEVPTPMMAFTFDDGPSPDNTYAVLNALSERKVKATFFMVGWAVRTWPELAREVVSEGHEIGNHSTEHGPYESAVLAAQMPGMQQILRDELGVVPVVHRAPGLTRGPEILDACAANGMYECHSEMPTPDVEMPLMPADRLLEEFVNSHQNGAFPIYHDGGKPRPTSEAIGPIIDAAIGFGYALVTATELVNSGTPVPGEPTYEGVRRSEPAPTGAQIAPPVPTPCCSVDARETLVGRLANPHVKRAERSRIVEQLAMLDDARR